MLVLPRVAFDHCVAADNAMALRLPDQTFVDLYGGLEDLAAGLIRTPGTPEQSFSDDPLRMLRAIRFASQLRFTIDEPVFTAIKENKERIRIITHRLFIRHFHELAVTQTIAWLDHNAIPYWDLCFMKDKDQVGADIYCDTALICEELELRAPQPSLYPAAVRGMARVLAQWADSKQYRVRVNQLVRPAEGLPLTMLPQLASAADGQGVMQMEGGLAHLFFIDARRAEPVTVEQARTAIQAAIANERKRQAALDEVKRLRATGVLHAELPSMRCVGYRQVWDMLEQAEQMGREPNALDLAQLRERGIAATRQLAKRQLTWLRGMPGRHIVACDQAGFVPQVLRLAQAVWPVPRGG